MTLSIGSVRELLDEIERGGLSSGWREDTLRRELAQLRYDGVWAFGGAVPKMDNSGDELWGTLEVTGTKLAMIELAAIRIGPGGVASTKDLWWRALELAATELSIFLGVEPSPKSTETTAIIGSATSPKCVCYLDFNARPDQPTLRVRVWSPATEELLFLDVLAEKLTALQR